MEIKRTQDGKLVEVKNGQIHIAGKYFGARVEKINDYMRSRMTDTLEKYPDCTHYVSGGSGCLLLTSEQGEKAAAAINDYRAEKAAKEKAERLALEATLKKFRVLVRSGHYLMDQAITTVCLEPDQDKYADWLRGNAVMASIEAGGHGIKIADSATAREITAGKSSGLSYARGESAMWVITPEQEAAILAECKATSDQRKAVKEANEAAEQAAIDAVFATAAQTGEKQQLERWVTNECTGHLQECSFDIAVKWAMPDGTVETTYTHCH